MSGVKAERPGLRQALTFLRPGDTLVVWRLDRLGRSLTDLIARMAELRQRNIGFKSLHESIDTTSPAGKLQFHIFSALAEFERDLIRERTMAGLRAARARGRFGGSKPKLTPDKVKMAASLDERQNQPHQRHLSDLGRVACDALPLRDANGRDPPHQAIDRCCAVKGSLVGWSRWALVSRRRA